MEITICGSMQFHEEMRQIKQELLALGHTVHIPKGVDLMDTTGWRVPDKDEAKIASVIEHDFIRNHFKNIELSDAILVLNHEKKGIPNYIGGNTFLEIGMAFWLNKKIFLLNPIPKMDYYTEIAAMRPIVIYGDFSKIS